MTDNHRRKGPQAPSLNEDGSNWVLYVRLMEDYIIGYGSGYRRHLAGRINRPLPPRPEKDEDNPDEQPTVDPDEQEKYEQDMDDYEYIQSSIRNIILSSVSDRLKNRLLAAKSASDMWTKLRGIYENQSILVQADLLAQLYSITCEEGTDPLVTIDEIQQKANEYAATGGMLREADQAAVLIKAMPREYHPTILALITYGVNPT